MKRSPPSLFALAQVDFNPIFAYNKESMACFLAVHQKLLIIELYIHKMPELPAVLTLPMPFPAPHCILLQVLQMVYGEDVAVTPSHIPGRFACPHLCVPALHVLEYSKKHSAGSDELKCLGAKHTADCFTLSEALMAVTSNEQRLMHRKRKEKFPLISNSLFPCTKGTLSTFLSCELRSE